MPRYNSFVGGFNTTQSPIGDCQRTVNLYPEILGQGAKAPIALFPTPGYDDFLTVAEGPVRALAKINERTFAVIGFTFYELFADGTSTNYGDVAADTRPATLSSNGDAGHQVFITSGTIGYIFDLNSSLLSQVVMDVDVGGFVDGFFVALDTTTSTFKISDLEDGTTWDPTQVAQRTTAADHWQGMAIKNREIWLYGSLTTDVYVNVGAYPFPFQPVPQGLLQKGTPAGFSPAVLEDWLIWLGSDELGTNIIYRSEGYNGVEISTPAVVNAIQSYTTVSDAVAFTYQFKGHRFYVLNFPSANATWVWDATTTLWHEWLYWDVDASSYQAARAICHVYAFGQHLVGDRATGVVYTLSGTTYTDAGGAAIRRLRRAPHLAAEGHYVAYHRFQLDMDVGVGLSSGQGSDPQIMLRWSDDGSFTWSNEIWTTIGAIGAYGTRVIWWQLGIGRDRVFEVAFSDPVPVRIVDCWIDFTPGDA